MNVTEIAKNKITVSFAPQELLFISNAVNEALELIEDWEFQTRTGETRLRASEIRAQLRKLLDDSKQCTG